MLIKRTSRLLNENMDRESVLSVMEEFNNKPKEQRMFPCECPEGIPIHIEFNLADASHVVNNIKLENDTIVCDITILDTPNGNILKTTLSEDKTLLPNPGFICDRGEKSIIALSMFFVGIEITD